ncbi:hypothetical protein J4475_00085 [Candidatus Woesearchaeota archaeon]|nr:hypothetical protein [Candidatus Woesearchaeota archaeon]
MELHYVCTGSCHGVATEEQWRHGAKTCAAQGCERHGQPLVKRLFCEKCGRHYKEGSKHSCA